MIDYIKIKPLTGNKVHSKTYIDVELNTKALILVKFIKRIAYYIECKVKSIC